MKRYFLLAITTLFTTFVFAQNVTKFLGIPVDGYKSEMIQKLKEKGYKYDAVNDCFSGEFNGRDVNIYIGTNNNKVYRIMVADANYVSEGDIIIRYNTLCRQFAKNELYIKVSLDDYEIPAKENISYEMTVHNKRYQASYYQVTHQVDSATIAQRYLDYLNEKYGGTDAVANMSEDKQQEIVVELVSLALSEYEDNSVWFMITQHYGNYGILMYYDNLKNQANGEDL